MYGNDFFSSLLVLPKKIITQKNVYFEVLLAVVTYVHLSYIIIHYHLSFHHHWHQFVERSGYEKSIY